MNEGLRGCRVMGSTGFVSYGSAMGERSVQELRETAIELQLAPIRALVHIPVANMPARPTRSPYETGGSCCRSRLCHGC